MPKVVRRSILPLSHQAGTPARLNFQQLFDAKSGLLTYAEISCSGVYRRQ
jgi:hypothetical protein